MSGTDFEELFKSPLDPPREDDRVWFPLAFGAVAGFAAAAALLLLGGGGSEVAATTSAPTPVTTSAAVATPLEYPAGYVEIAPDLAARPVAVVVGDEAVTVSFVTVVSRGSNPAVPNWPLGGSWLLEAADGGVVSSDRVVLSRFSPGVFSVAFALSDSLGPATALSRITMAERWDHAGKTGAITLPYAGEPFVAAEPVDSEVGDGVKLTLPDVELGRYQGRVEWSVTGPAPHGARVTVGATLLDAAGEAIGSYGALPELVAPRTTGIIDLTWQERFSTNQQGAATVRLDYTVGIVTVADTQISFDLVDVPTSR